MKISVAKKEAYEILVAGKPVLFISKDEWNGFVLLKDADGNSIIAVKDDVSSFENAFSGMLKGLNVDGSVSLVVVKASPNIIPLLSEA